MELPVAGRRRGLQNGTREDFCFRPKIPGSLYYACNEHRAPGLQEEMDMPIDDVAISYDIKFEKDHASVKVTYDLSVPVGGPALIADFQVTVDGTDLISGFLPGQTAFNGTKFHILSNPSKDAPVSFTLSSNQGWVASDDDVLRGEKDYDGAEFSD